MSVSEEKYVSIARLAVNMLISNKDSVMSSLVEPSIGTKLSIYECMSRNK